MDKSTYIPGPEYTATIITPQQMISDMEASLRSTHMITKALPPMTHMALQLMTNPPKMTPISPVWTWTVAQLTKG